MLQKLMRKLQLQVGPRVPKPLPTAQALPAKGPLPPSPMLLRVHPRHHPCHRWTATSHPINVLRYMTHTLPHRIGAWTIASAMSSFGTWLWPLSRPQSMHDHTLRRGP